MNDEPKLPSRDQGITDCLAQLAERATELGENETAVVLSALVAHRYMGVDVVMANTAAQHAIILKTAIQIIKPKST